MQDILEHGSYLFKFGFGKDLDPSVSPRKRTYVGENSLLSSQDIDKLIRGYEERSGISLDKMPVLSDKTQFWRNIGRYYVPKTVRQVPSRAGRALRGLGFTAIAPLDPRLLTWELQDLFQRANLGKGDYYAPEIGTVNVEVGNPATLAHEVGHWVDKELRKGPLRRGLFGYKDTGLSDTINSELAATVWARKAMGDKEWKQTGKKQLYPALATYLVDERPWATRSIGEWWKNVDLSPNKGWPKELRQALQDKDSKQVSLWLRRALKTVIENPDEDPGVVLEADDKTGRLAWSKHTPAGMKKLVGMLAENVGRA